MFAVAAIAIAPKPDEEHQRRSDRKNALDRPRAIERDAEEHRADRTIRPARDRAENAMYSAATSDPMPDAAMRNP